MNSRISSDLFALVSREEKAERLTPAESLSYRRLSERAAFRCHRKKETSARQPAKNSNARISPGINFQVFRPRTVEQIHHTKLTQRRAASQRTVQLESLAHCRRINGNDCCARRLRRDGGLKLCGRAMRIYWYSRLATNASHHGVT